VVSAVEGGLQDCVEVEATEVRQQDKSILYILLSNTSLQLQSGVIDLIQVDYTMVASRLQSSDGISVDPTVLKRAFEEGTRDGRLGNVIDANVSIVESTLTLPETLDALGMHASSPVDATLMATQVDQTSNASAATLPRHGAGK